eukprot:TRINITY_DN68099_c2_g15_i1.p1 TRINITY_DN68099_c2_g15~~TRINITY_DN68099_c2_g15_i1.p1  ORF type:complete len:284 (-),score=5.99 TRINITY_DN68099_c2_g15_i1:118-969(-)
MLDGVGVTELQSFSEGITSLLSNIESIPAPSMMCLADGNTAVNIHGAMSSEDAQHIYTALSQMHEHEKLSRSKIPLRQLAHVKLNYDCLQQTEDKQTVATSTLTVLPKDVVGVICTYLHPRDLVYLPLVGRVFFEVRDECMWGELYRRAFGPTTELPYGEYNQHFLAKYEPLKGQLWSDAQTWKTTVTACTGGGLKIGEDKYMVTTGPPLVGGILKWHHSAQDGSLLAFSVPAEKILLKGEDGRRSEQCLLALILVIPMNHCSLPLVLNIMPKIRALFLKSAN